MKKTVVTYLLLAVCSLSQAQTPAVKAAPAAKPKGTHNDQIYPPAPAAEKFISYDGAGFLINGHRRYLSSGTIHFARVPHELWHDRLLRMKQADFVNVESYVFWNYEEPRENEWAFTGDGDFEKFLNTAQDLGLTALIRVGPYVCAEWESGGWPLWLRFKPTFNLRTADPEFLKWNDHWYDKILPLVARHQINHGGNVILMQIENEHPLGWGVVNGDPYFDHLRAQVQKHDIEIPWFFSGLNHGGNPAPNDIDPAMRRNPWMSTEFWAGWFDTYGLVADKKLQAIDKANWTIMAHGGGGQNYYMLHGGSNFDLWSDDSTGSCYDFGAAIGQTGDLRPSYYKMKRANLLAQSFPGIIANSMSVLGEYKTAASGNKIEVLGARRGPGGTLLFLRNNDNQESTATLADGGSLRLARYATVALPRGVEIEKDVKIISANLAILTVGQNEDVSTVVFYGQPGQAGTITLTAPDKKELNFTVPTNNITETNLTLSSRSLRILVVPQDLSLRTWRIGAPRKQVLVIGPAFVQDVAVENGKPMVTYERFFGQPSTGQIAVYGAQGKSWHFAAPANDALEKTPAPGLGEWQTLPATASAAPSFDDKGWFAAEQPQQMGADGDNGSYAWYRANVSAAKTGSGTINLKAKDNALVFINGKLADGKNGNYTADFMAGKNCLAVFVSHAGRNKGYNYLKPVAELSPKGILGEVTLAMDKQKFPITGWKMRGGPDVESAVWKNPAAVSGWKSTADSAGMPVFYHTTFTAAPPAGLGIYPILRLKWTGLTRGMVWVNGHSLGRYPERIHVDSLYVPEPWLKTGGNDLVILDEMGASPVGVKLIIDRASREVAQTSALIDLQTPFVVPPENPSRDLAAMNVGNVAWKCSVTASSTYNRETAAALATDGNPDTTWKAAGKSIEPAMPNHPWVAVDLGKPTALGVVEILWDGKSRDYQYTVANSSDGQTWTKIGSQATAVPTSPDSPSELSRLNFKGETCRHLRVTIDEGRSLGIAEVRVFPFINK